MSHAVTERSRANLRQGGGRFAPTVDDEQIATLKREGRTSSQIAELLGCSKRTVERSLDRSRKAGLYAVPPAAKRADPYSEEELAFARMLLEDGCPYAEVARTLGRDRVRLAEKLPGYGVTDPGAALEVARMIRDFERLLERRGLSDISGRNR